uniref:Uncharacterized protein n=1 Tax=Mimivirus LCMiAC02 TaxID=2506609 RepID=A0A481Z090_9VIRU|nr:MAG: uncharacterized protein LCMiAC02_00160 [Mimivirus LCMiAC02]
MNPNYNKYYNKYIKYKRKYINLKRTIRKESIKYPIRVYQGGNNKSSKKINEKFYFVHMTHNVLSLIKILKMGKILPGKDVSKKYRHFGVEDGFSEIFANVNFEDLDNLSYFPSSSIILSSKILNDYDVGFNKGWHGGTYKDTILLKKNDSKTVRTKKINKIKKFLKNPSSLPKIVQGIPFHTHEMLFSGPVQIKKYLLAVVCLSCTQKNTNKIKKSLKKYPKVKLITKNYPLPKIKELQMAN